MQEYIESLLEPKELRATWNEIAQSDPSIEDHVDMVTLAEVVTYLIKKYGALLRNSAALYKVRISLFLSLSLSLSLSLALARSLALSRGSSALPHFTPSR